MFAPLRQQSDHQQTQQRPHGAGDQHETDKEERQQDVEVPRRREGHTISDEDGAAQQQEGPTAEAQAPRYLKA